MTNVPNDQIEPYESLLSRRVGTFAEQAVMPFDASAIAASVALDARRRGGLTRRLFRSPGAGARLGLIGAGALLAVAAGVVISGGANGLFAPAPTAPATATADTVAVRTCTPNDVDAVITAWDGAAGHRIATVELRQIGSSQCSVERLPQPWLAAGQGDQLIVGRADHSAGTITFGPGGVLTTLVQVGNYCGPAPEAPVTVAFTTENQATFVATALTPTDISGLPPCMGVAGPTDDITMHPWQ